MFHALHPRSCSHDTAPASPTHLTRTPGLADKRSLTSHICCLLAATMACMCFTAARQHIIAFMLAHMHAGPTRRVHPHRARTTHRWPPALPLRAATPCSHNCWIEATQAARVAALPRRGAQWATRQFLRGGRGANGSWGGADAVPWAAAAAAPVKLCVHVVQRWLCLHVWKRWNKCAHTAWAELQNSKCADREPTLVAMHLLDSRDWGSKDEPRQQYAQKCV